tara:strand:+ start:1472 stop:2233 length:762 start_codon:yes stop_codon:yes gene_type:complete
MHHYEIAKEIILAKKHVLVEKPIALKIEHAEELVDLSNKNNVNLMVGHLLLFHPAMLKIKEMIKNGRIGTLQYLYSNRLNLGTIRSEENVFWSLAPHDISLFQFFTESYPSDIKAVGSAFVQKKIHDCTITHLSYPEGISGHIFVSWLNPFKEHRLVIIGSEGMITFEDSAEGKPLKFHSKKFEYENNIPEKVDGPVEEISYPNKMPLTEELSYFIDKIDNGKIEIATGEEALQTTKILVEASTLLENNFLTK